MNDATTDRASTGSRLVVITVYDGVQLLDLAGPVDVFHEAAEQTGAYTVRVASPDGQPVRAVGGVRIAVDAALTDIDGPIDTLIVAGGDEEVATDAGGQARALVEQVRRLAGRSRRVASVCTGAFVLAAAGLLDGRRATTHWSSCAELAALFPGVRIDADAVVVRDGRISTAAATTAGIDLSLALVEEDHGADLARRIGKLFLVYLRRPGGQAQFATTARPTDVGDQALRQVMEAVARDPAADHGAEAMAARAMMSARHFSRRFTKDVGVTPGRYVEQIRVRAAQVLLETGDETAMETVARRCGFGSAETMRRAFQRVLGIAPAAYRERFYSACPMEHAEAPTVG
ncbi:AraC family transcriptional regulator [Planomonospora parontospora subsp. antibiotica]|uniref:GlxA family transcriptional regulator n=2 Tax=Planomonospora parontospora TaxID=58119 RepID=UPI00199861EC|nr:DJ-1/PfpI family protein [Planomonospora parontospora]GGL41539.1 AraC family transcriptional regulator [Planomonospora parontospora subsp. antibiotica]